MTDQMPGMSGPDSTPSSTPSSVTNAVRLMWVGAALSVLLFVVGLLRVGSVRAKAERDAVAQGYSGDQINAIANAVIVAAIVAGLIGAGLWIWMAIMNQKGRNWARITATVFFGISTLGILSSIPTMGRTDIFTNIIQVAIWAVGLAATIFMWMSSSNPHYQRRTQEMPGQGYTGPGPQQQPPPMPT